jgi:hypothetical protein
MYIHIESIVFGFESRICFQNGQFSALLAYHKRFHQKVMSAFPFWLYVYERSQTVLINPFAGNFPFFFFFFHMG